MRILLTNDDGVHADGIRVLYECLNQIAEVTIVAPLEEKSTTGHTLTLNQPLRVQQIEQNIFGCSGFPADCILMALGCLQTESPPDLIVSGINRGANLAQDIYYSGTVAGAREGAFHGIPAIAVSTVTDVLNQDQPIYYFTAGLFIREFITHGLHNFIPPMGVVNVNVPNLEKEKIHGVTLANLGFRNYSEDIEKRIDCRNRPYYWIGGNYRGDRDIQGSDCEIVSKGNISVGLLNLLHRTGFDETKFKQQVGEFVFK